jgi:hypothetical protein
MGNGEPRWAAVGPEGLIYPGTLLAFVQLPYFERRWLGLGLTDDDMRALEDLILADPEAAPVEPGTRGLRKTRFAPPSTRRGKSGGCRVMYAVIRECGWVVLATVYPKSAQVKLRPEEKRLLGDAIELLRRTCGAK